jgi:hypothetical protein
MSRWAWVFSRRKRMMEDLDQDIRDYIERETQDNIERGRPPDEARYAALRKFGNVTRVREETWEVWSFVWLEELWHDVRFGVRQLRRNPGFTAVAVLTLALGIGANTAIFALMDTVILRRLPVEKPGELFQVQVGSADEGGGGGGGESPFPTPMWEQLRDHQDPFYRIFAWSGRNASGLPEWGTGPAVNEIWVSGGFFSGLGLRPAAGRLIADSDDRRGCPAVAVLSYSFWREHYGGAKSAVGSTLALSGHPFEVIGVAPPGFFGMEVGGKFDVTAPICASAILGGKESRLDNVEFSWLNVGGRISPKLSRAQQTAQLRILATRLFVPPNASPEEREALMKIILRIVPAATGISDLRGQFSQPLQILMAVVGMVLLIACANLASLTLARGAPKGDRGSAGVGGQSRASDSSAPDRVCSAFLSRGTARCPSRALDRSPAGAHHLDTTEHSLLPGPLPQHPHSWIRPCNRYTYVSSHRLATGAALDAGVAEFRRKG